MRDALINLILLAILAFFLMQTYVMYQNQQDTLTDIKIGIGKIDYRLTQIEFIAE